MLRVPQLASAILLAVTASALTWYTFSDRTTDVSTAASGQAPAGRQTNGTVRPAATGSQRHTHHARAPPTAVHVRVVAIGDLHADLQATVEALIVAGVVGRTGHWTGGQTHVVQTGDVIDRGSDTIALFEYLDALRKEAQQAGGNVISLMGNHEYMNLLYDWSDVTAADRATFGNDKFRRWQALTTGDIGTSWKEHYRIACRFPLHPSLGPIDTDYDGKKTPVSHSAIAFVHGGLSPLYPDLTPFPSRMNTIGKTALRKLQFPQLEDPMDENEIRLTTNRHGDSPLWYRGWAREDAEPDCAQLDAVLEKTGTSRMIMGHTAQLQHKGILSRCDGKILVIDTGISSVYIDDGGIISALSIEYSLTPKAGPAGSAGTVWEEREVITALYQKGEPDSDEEQGSEEEEEEEYVSSEVLVDSLKEITEPFTG